ncbi:MAG: hypothetical protein CAF45_004910 [Nitrospira sp. CG24E]|nr:MAG: hypothetical protein CAF45_004910 [Nitrospira sp. CG24E]
MTLAEELELQKAGVRIQNQAGQYGGARPAALAWLVAFLQDDHTKYSMGDWTLRWWEVLKFCGDGGLPPEELRLCNLTSITGRAEGLYTNIALAPNAAARFWMSSLKSSSLAGLKHYVAGGALGTGALPMNFTVRKGTPGLAATVPHYDAAFTYQMINLVAEFGPRLGQCRYCKTMYLAGRSDKTYCSAVCQAMQWKIDHPKTPPVKPSKPTVKGRKKPTAKKGGRHAKR